MGTYWEKGSKEYFKKRELERNKKQLAKANCTVNKKYTMVIRIQPWCTYIINMF